MNRSILYSRTSQFEYAKQDIDILKKGRWFLSARGFYHCWQDQPDRVLNIRDQLLEIPDIHPSHLLYVNCLVNDFDLAVKYYAKAVDSMSRAFIDFGPLRAGTKAVLPSRVNRQLEQHQGYTELAEKQGVDEAWRIELAERVNELTSITWVLIATTVYLRMR
jgi:hypothetical protein